LSATIDVMRRGAQRKVDPFVGRDIAKIEPVGAFPTPWNQEDLQHFSEPRVRYARIAGGGSGDEILRRLTRDGGEFAVPSV